MCTFLVTLLVIVQNLSRFSWERELVNWYEIYTLNFDTGSGIAPIMGRTAGQGEAAGTNVKGA